MRSTERLFDFGSRRVRLVRQSLAELDEGVDALVSSDDNYLTHGGGVSAALWAKAGPALEAEVRGRPRLGLGDVHVTGAGELRASLLLHAVTIDFDLNRSIDAAGFQALTRRAIATADSWGCGSLAMPLLGTGAGRLSRLEAVGSLARVIDSWLRLPSRVSAIVLAFIDSSFEEVDAALRNLPGPVVPVETLAEQAGLQKRWQKVIDADPEARGMPLSGFLEDLVGDLAQRARRAGEDGPETRARDLLGRSLPSTPPSGQSSTGRPLALGAAIRQAEELLQHIGIAFPTVLRGSLLVAAQARNQLAHSPVFDSRSALALSDAVGEACDQLLEFLLNEAPRLGLPPPERQSELPLQGAARPAPPQPSR